MHKTQKSESFEIAVLLAIVGGFLDAYTYCCRDKVFANAQTGNFVRLAMALANGEYILILRYIISILSFSFGILAAINIRNKNFLKLHWRQIILIVEIGIVVIVSFIPIRPITNLAANVFVSFLCAMQVESFKKVLGHPFSSTMCTGNLRSGIEHLCYAVIKKDYQLLKHTGCYLVIIMSFIIGAFTGAHTTQVFLGKAILLTLIPIVLSIWNMNDVV